LAKSDYDVVVLGAGPGGYVAAIRASQLGLKAAIIEKDDGTGYAGIGGVCLNWGCIPSKALLRNAELVSIFKRGQEFGFSFENFSYDLGTAIDRSRKVAFKMANGVNFLLKKNKIDLFKGQGILVSARQVEVPSTGETLSAKNIILATGARPRGLPGLAIDKKHVISSREALEVRQLPASVVIVGGGAVGVEFAYFFNAYGSKVAVLEMLPHLVPNEDQEISQALERALKRQGIDVLTGTKVEGLDRKNGAVVVKYADPAGNKGQRECQVVLLGVGVQPNTDGIGLEKLGIALNKGFVEVNDQMATNVPGVYAVGDVTGKMALAHVAFAQGEVAATVIAGREAPVLRYKNMPRATYCQPQVASIGLTEAEAKVQSLSIKVGKFPFSANGKAVGMGEGEGMVKVVVDANDGDLIGAHLIGPDVTELLGELGLMKTMEATPLEMGWTVHAHPTLSEVVREAVLATQGEAIHI
jgi:dihydrolipoamide dehydrogenase